MRVSCRNPIPTASDSYKETRLIECYTCLAKIRCNSQNFYATQTEGTGVAEDGREEVLGLWLGEKEGVRYGLKARGAGHSDRGGGVV